MSEANKSSQNHCQAGYVRLLSRDRYSAAKTKNRLPNAGFSGNKLSNGTEKINRAVDNPHSQTSLVKRLINFQANQDCRMKQRRAHRPKY